MGLAWGVGMGYGYGMVWGLGSHGVGMGLAWWGWHGSLGHGSWGRHGPPHGIGISMGLALAWGVGGGDRAARGIPDPRPQARGLEPQPLRAASHQPPGDVVPYLPTINYQPQLIANS
jgi:hypothetical protein